MPNLTLPTGSIVTFDIEDAEMVMGYNWRHHPKGYAACKDGLMHRLITEAPRGTQVDHVNGDRLDNRRTNLRLATNGQNQANRKMAPHSSRFKGVHRQNSMWYPWVATIRHDGNKPRRIGTFADEVKAAKAYDAEARIHHGKFAALNFPRRGEQSAHRGNVEGNDAETAASA